MITQEQITDLREGDVVELSWPSLAFPAVSVVIRGPLRAVGIRGELRVGEHTVRRWDGTPARGSERTLVVIERDPRPFYTNHPRTEPVIDDVVLREKNGQIYVRGSRWYDERGTWWANPHDGSGGRYWANFDRGETLTLLVDGETKQVVR